MADSPEETEDVFSSDFLRVRVCLYQSKSVLVDSLCNEVSMSLLVILFAAQNLCVHWFIVGGEFQVRVDYDRLLHFCWAVTSQLVSTAAKSIALLLGERFSLFLLNWFTV